jgi:hypothetical protein
LTANDQTANDQTANDQTALVAGDYNRFEITRLLARTLLGLLFLLSAWLKAVDYPSFEGHLLTQVGTGWKATPLLATLLIAIEFALGFYWMNILMANRWFEQATAALLLFFSVYLGLLWLEQGNGVDCGCMGSALQMSPSEALAKNLVAGALLVFAGGKQALLPIVRNSRLLIGLTIALALGTTAYTTPPPWSTAPVIITKPINDTPLFSWGFPYPKSETQFLVNSARQMPRSGGQDISLTPSSGRLTAVLSVHCRYCAWAAERIGKLSQELPNLNIQLVLVGRPQELNPFIQAYNLQSVHFFHPPKKIVQDFVPQGVPEIWFTAADGRQWTLTLRQITPATIEKLSEIPHSPNK